MAQRFLLSFFTVLLIASCGARPSISADDITCMWLKKSDAKIARTMTIDSDDWPIIVKELNHCRQKMGKYCPDACLVIEYGNGPTYEINVSSNSYYLIIGHGDSPFVSKKKHPTIDRYIERINGFFNEQ